MGYNYMILILLFVLFMCLINGGDCQNKTAKGHAINWGTMSRHPLQPDIVVKLLKDNGFEKVKLFEAESGPLKALGNSGIQVMLGIPNGFLAPLSRSVQAASAWVKQNVSDYISKYDVDIRYIAVGNEPFLKAYKSTYLRTTFPALKNIQEALNKAGLGKKIKVTIPFNADVYQSASGLPSGGDFRTDIHDLMVSIVKFLSDNDSPLTMNIYPFLSLSADAGFPKDYAFFDGTPASPVVDGSITYTNVFDANFDTLISALEKNDFSSLEVIVGEVGWPTDGNPSANADTAKRFNQGLLNRTSQGTGTPKRKNAPTVYIFSLLDEDFKSTLPGNFERHWGIFTFDGKVKYELDTGNGKGLVPAKGVKYLDKEWCVMAPDASTTNPKMDESLAYACDFADCTSTLDNGSSCGSVDAKMNASYIFNMYYQTISHAKGSCNFNNLATLTTKDPSQDSCKFHIMMDVEEKETQPPLGPPEEDDSHISPNAENEHSPSDEDLLSLGGRRPTSMLSLLLALVFACYGVL
ncbi:O-Glycosyl hydrolases family 17 protein [Euphorbia peplus]|nr:O-Glycosyl hydrolases family 17 protein [Euphorbia peplus]